MRFKDRWSKMHAVNSTVVPERFRGVDLGAQNGIPWQRSVDLLPPKADFDCVTHYHCINVAKLISSTNMTQKIRKLKI